MHREKKLIGHIGVDAGICWIGDPCYILHKDVEAEGKPKAIGNNWDEFCDKLYPNHSGHQTHWQFKYDMGHDGLGVVVSTGYGDGHYPVYAEFEGDQVARVWVEFISDRDEDEDEEF